MLVEPTLSTRTSAAAAKPAETASASAANAIWAVRMGSSLYVLIAVSLYRLPRRLQTVSGDFHQLGLAHATARR